MVCEEFVRMKLGFMEIDFLWKIEGINNFVCPATSALMYMGSGEGFTMRNFIVCTVHLILSG